MVKRMTGAGVNRSAARKALEVAALRAARLAEHEAAVTEAVAMYFDRSQRAATTREEARVKAERIIAEAGQAASVLDGQADAAVAKLRRLGEPVVEIAAMVDLAVSGVRAALAREQRAPEDVGRIATPPNDLSDDSVLSDGITTDGQGPAVAAASVGAGGGPDT